MDSKNLIEKTRLYVENELAGDGSGHDWWHVYRVWSIAKKITQKENADPTIVELSALLHDIADWKFNDGDESAGPRQATAWLNKNGVDPRLVGEVCEIISTLSYKGAGVATPMRTIEGKIVQDADRLDAIGAVGIARTFAYGGNKNRLMYHPEETPVMHESFDHYKNNKGHTINHFHEKLLLLKDRMNTESAKKLAEQRHLFMENYLDRFHKEWNGDA
ncbi:MAG: HD domain-containing protein [Nitrospina sp.]|nr:HD domain-containing protein [Nitrospina sp.]